MNLSNQDSNVWIDHLSILYKLIKLVNFVKSIVQYIKLLNEMDQIESKSNEDRENNNKNNSSGSSRNVGETRLEHVGSLGTHNYIEFKNNCIIQPSNDEVLHNSEESASNIKEVSHVSRSSALGEKARKVKKKKKDKQKVKPRRKDSEWIQLNVGGKIIQTTRTTLTKDPTSMLFRMFSETSVWESTTDPNGAYLIDRDPHYFKPLINFLRHGDMIIDRNVSVEGVIKEAEFFQVQGAIESARKLLFRPKSNYFLVIHRAFYLTERVLSDYLLLEGPVESCIMDQLEGCTLHDGIWVLTHSRLRGSKNKISFSELCNLLSSEGWSISVSSGSSDGGGGRESKIWENTQYQTYVLCK